MGTRSYIARQIGDDQYLTIYCQLNGYPEDTGATLVKHYDTSEKVNALLALGDLYYLREKLSPDPGRHDFIAPQPGVTLAYRRDGDCPGLGSNTSISMIRMDNGSTYRPGIKRPSSAA